MRGLLKEYYSKAGDLSPHSIERREFGFGDFERKISYRHMAFRDWKALRTYLTNDAPPFVSVSSAHYQHPDGRPMENKGRIGAELVFDLDANDLNLPCAKEHGRSWVCDKCLDGVKDETHKLIEDFLVADFGFGEKDIGVNFSGNRGYHIHIDNKTVFDMDSDERKAISDYISANGIEMQSFFPNLGMKGKRLEGPKPTDYGWGGKLAGGVIRALNTGIGELTSLGIDRPTANLLFRKRAEVILGITTGNWDKINIPKKGELWAKVLSSIAVRQSDSIDKNVSTDVHKLLRLPDTIHGDTGLIAKRLKSASDLSKFDPMNDAVAFTKGTLKVKVESSPKFEISGQSYGPFNGSSEELDTAAAIYLILKRSAALI
ncbi:MAG: DNA primase catalytic subunit PriS [Candidatus Micrarchaeota archaeon]|nr:DNA primase catalytic subunit PriS [Candidatus Micrarchaeota archaeon]